MRRGREGFGLVLGGIGEDGDWGGGDFGVAVEDAGRAVAGGFADGGAVEFEFGETRRRRLVRVGV